jgi:hypothetical protein
MEGKAENAGMHSAPGWGGVANIPRQVAAGFFCGIIQGGKLAYSWGLSRDGNVPIR